MRINSKCSNLFVINFSCCSVEDEAPAVQCDWIGSIVSHRQKPRLGGSGSHFLTPEVDGGQRPSGEFGKAGAIIIAPWCQKDRLGAMG